MDFEEYRRMDAMAMAAAVADGQATARELLECALARTDAVNPDLNAVVARRDARAREEAADPPAGPFAGVPFLVKDLFQELAGEGSDRGCRALRDAGASAEVEAGITRRWRAAGLVVFGRTNTPEFGARSVTEPVIHGPVRNPWHPALSPGGSSGGAAAAVAAGIVPVAGANDGGGSIRIPASHCGLFGFKPGRGRTPAGPAFSEWMHGAAVHHVISRSVRDSAALLDAALGAPPARPFSAAVAAAPGSLRIGYTTRSPIGTEVDPECRAAVEGAARLLEGLGHRVEEAEPAIDGQQLARDWLTLWFGQVAAMVDRARRRTGAGAEGFELETRVMAALGRSLSAADYVAAHERWNRYCHAMHDFHRQYDLYLTPTVARPPPRIGETALPGWQRTVLEFVLRSGTLPLLRASGLIERLVRDELGRVPFTQLANLTGAPAMSVPLHWTPHNLPVGVQLVAPVTGEAGLFSLAGQLETASPWFDRVPALP